MKILALVAIGALAAGLVYGFLAHKNKTFPYRYLSKVVRYLPGTAPAEDDWAIGIYQGTTPFELAPAEGVRNPVLTAADVSDIDAAFVADPFMVRKDGTHYMFFEVLNRKTGKGDIGYATSADGRKWDYRKIVLNEKWHLSYPYVFEWNGEHYMIPETNQDLSVKLYKATAFPEKWQVVGNLLSGYRFVDASVFRFRDKWWMLVSTTDNDALNLYHAADLTGEWKPHPLNPIVKFNRHTARPAGRVVVHDGRPYRFAQDDYPSYGIQAFAFEITELSETAYAERIVAEKPIVGKTGSGWNAAGMHHIDLHPLDGKWLAAVDGRSR